MEPGLVQRFDALFSFFVWFRIPISMCLDLRIVKYKKFIALVSAAVSTVCFLIIATGVCNTPYFFVYTLVVEKLLGDLVINTIRETLWVE